MKKFFLFLVSLSAGIVLFIFIINNVGWKEVLLAFRTFSFKAGLIILSLTISSFLVRAWRWKTVLKSQGYNVPILRIVEYYLSGNSIGFFFPMVIFGGEIFRGYDLKEKYLVPWPKSIASVFIDRFLELTVNAIVIIFGVFFFFSKYSHSFQKLEIYLFLLAIMAALSLGILYSKIFRKESIVGFFIKKFNLIKYNGMDTAIDTEKEIFAYFGLKNKTMWQGFGLTLITQLILLTRAFLLISFLGKYIGFFAALSVVAFSFLAVTIPIPAAIGSHEAVQSFIFNYLGLGADTGLAFVLIIRGAELTVALIGLALFFHLWLSLVRSFLLRKIGKFLIKKK